MRNHSACRRDRKTCSHAMKLQTNKTDIPAAGGSLKCRSGNSGKRCHKPTRIYSEGVLVLLKIVFNPKTCEHREIHDRAREPSLQSHWAAFTQPRCCGPPFAAYLVVINRQSLGLCSGHPTFFFLRRTHPSLGFTHYLSTEKWKNLTSSLGSKLSSTTVVRHLLLAASHLLTQVLNVKNWLLPITPVPAPWQSPSQQ